MSKERRVFVSPGRNLKENRGIAQNDIRLLKMVVADNYGSRFRDC